MFGNSWGWIFRRCSEALKIFIAAFFASEQKYSLNFLQISNFSFYRIGKICCEVSCYINCRHIAAAVSFVPNLKFFSAHATEAKIVNSMEQTMHNQLWLSETELSNLLNDLPSLNWTRYFAVALPFNLAVKNRQQVGWNFRAVFLSAVLRWCWSQKSVYLLLFRGLIWITPIELSSK